MRRLLLILCALTLTGAAAVSAQSGPVNLVATPSVKAALRASFLKAHRQYTSAQVKGPIKGRTYYGSYKGKEYALAVFSIPRFGTTDQPELFVRAAAGGAWVDKGDTGGEVCAGWVPLPLIKLWALTFNGSCYSAP